MTARIIALCNQKGGVGKTATCFHLARAAIVAGRRVLTIDLDPQGNLTTSIAKEPVEDDQIGLADVLADGSQDTIADVIVPGIWDGLDHVPTTSHRTAAFVREQLARAGQGRERRLADALAQVLDDYDVIFIDCPPSLDQLTINGLTAAHTALIVTQSELYAVNGIAGLLDTIAEVQGHYNPSLTVAGIMINLHDERTLHGRAWYEQLGEAADARGVSLFEPPIPRRTMINDAHEAATGLDEWGREALPLVKIYAAYFNYLEGAR